MSGDLAHWAYQFPAPLATMLIAAMPVVELRGAIPYAVTIGHLPVAQALGYALIGNALPVIPLLVLLGPLEKPLRRVGAFDRFLTWLFDRTRAKSHLVERYEAFGLCMFVAVPLPGTGAWTGAILAHLLQLPLRFAAPAIFLGIVIAGALVSAVSYGGIAVWHGLGH
jgi:uncharacterized membrane protein